MGPSRRLLEALLLPSLVGVLFLLIWSAAVWLSGTDVFPSPLEVFRAVLELARGGQVLPYVRDSLFRVLCGYALAVCIGIPAGLIMGLHAPTAHVAGAVIQLMRPISPLAWIPVAILLFGVTNTAAIFLIFLASFFPVAMSMMEAVRRVPGLYLRAGRNFGLDRWVLLRRVILPAALPYALTGLRISIGIAWLVVVAAEMIGIDSGLGYLIIDARNAGKRYDLVIAGMLLVGLIGLGFDTALRRLERARSLRWAFHRDS